MTGFPRTVILAGTGRSGTSWLGKLLDSSPDVFYKAQPDDVNRYPWFRDIPSRLDPTPELDRYREPFAQALREAFWAYSINLHGPPQFPKTFLHWRAWQTLSFGMRAWRKLTRGSAPIMRIPRQMFMGDPYAATLVIKSVVSNLRLAWIHRHFPEIKIVLIVRHPGGYLNSIFRGARDHGWQGVGKRERLDGTVLPFPRPEHAQYAHAYENGTDFERELIYWIVANETPVIELGRSPNLKVVLYEQLCSHPVRVAQDILAFAAIPFTNSTLRFIEESTSYEGPGYYGVYKDPARAASKWREQLDEHQKGIIFTYLRGCSLRGFWAPDVERSQGLATAV